MSRENRLPDYLERVRQNAADARSFVDGFREEDFLNDRLTQDAVAACLVAIGSMLNRIEERYPGFFTAYPDFSWLDLRDACVDFLENCFDVDPMKLWHVTQTDLPELLAVLPSIDADVWVPASKISRTVDSNQTTRPSVVLNRNRQAIREAAVRNKTVNPRVFGSVLRGEDTEESDLDLLVDDLDGTTLFDLCGLQSDLERLLGIRVDVLTPGSLPEKWRDQVVSEALPVWAEGIYPEFIAKHPEIQWEKMRGLRNHIVHDYTNIKLDILWKVLQTSLPELLAQLSEMTLEE